MESMCLTGAAEDCVSGRRHMARGRFCRRETDAHLIEKTLRAFLIRVADRSTRMLSHSSWLGCGNCISSRTLRQIRNGWASFWLAYEVLFSVPFCLEAFGLGVL